MKKQSQMISKLLSQQETRESYLRAILNVVLPSQIRGLRKRRELSQKNLGDLATMKQARICKMEMPGETNFTLETIIRIAAAMRVGVIVKLVPFSEMKAWERSFSQDTFNVTPIEEDEAFLAPRSLHSRLFQLSQPYPEAVINAHSTTFVSSTKPSSQTVSMSIDALFSVVSSAPTSTESYVA